MNRTLTLSLASSAIIVSALLTGCNNNNEQLTSNTRNSSTIERPADSGSPVEPEKARAVIYHYADVALATYEDALTTATALKKASAELVATPSEKTLEQAKAAWKAARIPYQQSEVFRFGNPVVDDWEGQLNAWPLDEGLIDYVQYSQYAFEMGNDGALANIVGNTRLNVGGETLDLARLTPEILADLNELGGSEANVATGYHAIEFLLWGQDLYGTGPGAGSRPATDFARGNACTGGHCERRGQYLLTAVDLLINDLEFMTGQW